MHSGDQQTTIGFYYFEFRFSLMFLCLFPSRRLSWLATRPPVFERSLNVFRINVSFRTHWRHIFSTRCKIQPVGPSLVNVHAHAAVAADDDDDVVMMQARYTTALAMHAGDKDASYCYTRCNKNNNVQFCFRHNFGIRKRGCLTLSLLWTRHLQQ